MSKLDEHEGATEAYADALHVLALTMAEEDLTGSHVDGAKCSWEMSVVWVCTVCGKRMEKRISNDNK